MEPRIGAGEIRHRQQQPEDDINYRSSELLTTVLNMPIDKNRIVTRAPEEPFRLTFVDVTCLLVNRAIGTGIFNGPQEVMKGVQSPGVAVLLWVCGCIYGFAGAHVFLEYGLNVPRYIIDGIEQSVPRSGGELHYLQYVFSWPRYKKGTVLLSGVMFGISFICIGNMASNCIDCAVRLIQIANPEETDRGLIRGIAILIATVTCFIHAFSRRGGIFLNNILAGIKVLFLVFIIVSTWVVAGGRSGMAAVRRDTDANTSSLRDSQGPTNHSQAFLFVIFAFFGFDQPSYVLGEIKHPRKNFPRAMWWGMGIVSVLYVAVNICYMIVVPAEVQMNNNVAQEFFRRAFPSNYRATQTFDAFLAISSFGNVVVWTYTAARMKQEVAKQGYIPFAKFFATNKDVSLGRLLLWFEGAPWNSTRRKIPFLNPANHSEKTPVGALSLHLMSCIVLILATWGISAKDSYIILSTLFSYLIAAWFGSLLAIGILLLHWRGPPATQSVHTPNHNGGPQKQSIKRSWSKLTKGTVNTKLSVVCAIVYLIGSLYPIIASWVPPPPSLVPPSVAWYVVPLTSLCVLAFSAIWFLGFIVIAAYRSHVGRKVFVYVCEPEFDWAEGTHQNHGDVEAEDEREAASRMYRGGLILTHETIYKVWRGTETDGLESRQLGSLQTPHSTRRREPDHQGEIRPSGADFQNTDFATSRFNGTRSEDLQHSTSRQTPSPHGQGSAIPTQDNSMQIFL